MRFLSRRTNTAPQVFTERRSSPRFQPIDGAFAFLDLKMVVAGQILNVNENGLAFRYVASEAQSEKSDSVNIIVRGQHFRSKRLPCETVWDYADPHELSFGPFSVRYCGVRFRDLTADQRSELSFFIDRYTKQGGSYSEPVH